MTRRLVLAITVALVVSGCHSENVGVPVPLITGIARGLLAGECYPNSFAQTLNADPKYGTSFTSDNGTPLPVVWPPGYTARRFGTEVQVLDRNGQVVARTGHGYNIQGGTTMRQGDSSTYVYFACGFVNPA